MTKRTLAIIVGLFLITLVLFLLLLSTTAQPAPGGGTPEGMPPVPTSVAQSVLRFAPTTLTIPQGATVPQTVTIMLATGKNNDTGVQLELSYNPQAFSSVGITAGTLFQNPVVLEKKIDQEKGTLSYVYGISPTQTAVAGTGSVAVLTLTPVAHPTDQKGNKLVQTTVQLLPTSEVAAVGRTTSMLNPLSLTTPLSITFSGVGQ